MDTCVRKLKNHHLNSLFDSEIWTLFFPVMYLTIYSWSLFLLRFPHSCGKSKNIKMFGTVRHRKVFEHSFEHRVQVQWRDCCVDYVLCVLSHSLRKCAFLGTVILSTPLVILCILIWYFILLLSLCCSGLPSSFISQHQPHFWPLRDFNVLPYTFSHMVCVVLRTSCALSTMKHSYYLLKCLHCTALNSMGFKCKFTVESLQFSSTGLTCR